VTSDSAYPYTATNSPGCAASFVTFKEMVYGGAVPVSLATANPLYLALQQAPVTITIWADGLNELFVYFGGTLWGRHTAGLDA